MSHSYTLKASCLGTTLEWNCGSPLAEFICPGIRDKLDAVCEASQLAGNGYCGMVSTQFNGLSAYHTIHRIAPVIFASRTTGKSVLLREFCAEYRHVLYSAQHLEFLHGNANNWVSIPGFIDFALDFVEKSTDYTVGLEAAINYFKDMHTIDLEALAAAIGQEDWALSLSVRACY